MMLRFNLLCLIAAEEKYIVVGFGNKFVFSDNFEGDTLALTIHSFLR